MFAVKRWCGNASKTLRVQDPQDHDQFSLRPSLLHSAPASQEQIPFQLFISAIRSTCPHSKEDGTLAAWVGLSVGSWWLRTSLHPKEADISESSGRDFSPFAEGFKSPRKIRKVSKVCTRGTRLHSGSSLLFLWDLQVISLFGRPIGSPVLLEIRDVSFAYIACWEECHQSE